MKTEKTQMVIDAIRKEMVESLGQGKRSAKYLIERIAASANVREGIVSPVFSTMVTAGFIYKERHSCECCGGAVWLYYGWNSDAGDYEAFKLGVKPKTMQFHRALKGTQVHG